MLLQYVVVVAPTATMAIPPITRDVSSSLTYGASLCVYLDTPPSDGAWTISTHTPPIAFDGGSSGGSNWSLALGAQFGLWRAQSTVRPFDFRTEWCLMPFRLLTCLLSWCLPAQRLYTGRQSSARVRNDQVVRSANLLCNSTILWNQTVDPRPPLVLETLVLDSPGWRTASESICQQTMSPSRCSGRDWGITLLRPACNVPLKADAISALSEASALNVRHMTISSMECVFFPRPSGRGGIQGAFLTWWRARPLADQESQCEHESLGYCELMDQMRRLRGWCQLTLWLGSWALRILVWAAYRARRPTVGVRLRKALDDAVAEAVPAEMCAGSMHQLRHVAQCLWWLGVLSVTQWTCPWVLLASRELRRLEQIRPHQLQTQLKGLRALSCMFFVIGVFPMVALLYFAQEEPVGDDPDAIARMPTVDVRPKPHSKLSCTPPDAQRVHVTVPCDDGLTMPHPTAAVRGQMFVSFTFLAKWGPASWVDTEMPIISQLTHVAIFFEFTLQLCLLPLCVSIALVCSRTRLRKRANLALPLSVRWLVELSVVRFCCSTLACAGPARRFALPCSTKRSTPRRYTALAGRRLALAQL